MSGFHEISADRVSWEPASSLAELFPAVPRSHQPEVASITADIVKPLGNRDEPVLEVQPVEGGWHYMNDSKVQCGPVPREKLLDLLNRGEIFAQTLVWNTSLKNWKPLESVPDFQACVAVSQKKPPRQLNVLALLSFIAAFVWLGGLGSIAAIILGVLALVASRRQKTTEHRWLALSGVVIGSVGVVLTFALVLVFYFAWREPEQLTPEQISTRYQDKVYFIKARAPDPGSIISNNGSGSGILISNSQSRGLIATNLHVLNLALARRPEERRIMRENGISKLETLEVKNPSQVALRTARLAAFNRNNDLAFLIIEMEHAVPGAVPIIRKHRLHHGESSVALGYPLGLDYKVSPGAISGTSNEGGVIWTTCPINNGNSGGPLFLNRKALLAGLIPIGVNDTQGLNGAEPAEELVVPIQAGRTEKWIWASDLKDTVIELVKQVPVRD